jgi:hypothetical protein
MPKRAVAPTRSKNRLRVQRKNMQELQGHGCKRVAMPGVSGETALRRDVVKRRLLRAPAVAVRQAPH